MKGVSKKAKALFGGLSVLLIFTIVGHAGAKTLKRGDILITDVDAGAIILIDPVTGAQTVISSGGNLVSPMGLAIDSKGDILVADSGSVAVIRIDPKTGGQTVVSSGGLFVLPSDLTIDATGQIFVVDADAFGPDVISGGTGGVIRVDPVTGEQTAVSSGGNFHGPTGIALDAAGHILVADVDFGGSPGVSGPGAIIRVDPTTGAQTVISTGGAFVGPVRVAEAPTGQIFVSDHGSFRTGTTIGAIFRIDPATGAQTVIYNSSSGGSIQGPEGIALDAAGQILVAFKGHPDFDVPDGIARIDPVSGALSLVSFGGSFEGPFGIAILTKAPKEPEAEVEFRLPYPAGLSYTVSQGNNADTNGDQLPDADGNHKGKSKFAFDFLMAEGSDVAASAAGTVVDLKSAFPNPPPVDCKHKKKFKDEANYVLLKHADGTRTLYLHLCPGCVFVNEGEYVQRGQIIAKSGQTGWACGPHLHFQRQRESNGWFSQSLEVQFADVLSNGGVPIATNSYPSGNSP